MKECRHELLFDKCMIVVKPTTLDARVKALDVETMISLDGDVHKSDNRPRGA